MALVGSSHLSYKVWTYCTCESLWLTHWQKRRVMSEKFMWRFACLSLFTGVLLGRCYFKKHVINKRFNPRFSTPFANFSIRFCFRAGTTSLWEDPIISKSNDVFQWTWHMKWKTVTANKCIYFVLKVPLAHNKSSF